MATTTTRTNFVHIVTPHSRETSGSGARTGMNQATEAAERGRRTFPHIDPNPRG
jgi:hypothetical protein